MNLATSDILIRSQRYIKVHKYKVNKDVNKDQSLTRKNFNQSLQAMNA